MEKRITFYPPQTWRGRFLGTILTLVAFLLGATQVGAQNVLIGPNSGSLVNAMMSEEDTGWESGFSALWRHEQLALSMTGTDRDELTASGEPGMPSSVFKVVGEGANKKLVMVGGRRPTFIVVSLPKGYRITGYTMVLANDLVGANLGGDFSTLNTNQEHYNYNNASPRGAVMRFYETKPWSTNGTNSGTTGRRSQNDGYNANQTRYINLGTDWNGGGQIGTTDDDVLATAKKRVGTEIGTQIDITPDDANDEFVIQRTSQSDDDMGNQLYFRLVKNYCFYGLTIKSFEIKFTAEGTFDASVTPDNVGPTQSVVQSPFPTSKIDVGEMKPHKKDENGQTYFSYEHENVTDLTGYNFLYQEGAVADGKPTEGVVTPKITPVEVDGERLYALGEDTYYIEPPIEIATQGKDASGNPIKAPIGYRVVGATFKCLYGTDTEENENAPVYTKYKEFLLLYSNNNTTYYLGTDPGSRDVETNWFMDEDGYVRCGTNGTTYLTINTVNTPRYGNVTYVTSTTNKSDAYIFKKNAGSLQVAQEGDYANMYVCYGAQNNNSYYWRVLAKPTTPGQSLQNPVKISLRTTQVEIQTGTTSVPAFHPGAYTLNIYDKTGKTIQESIKVNGLSDSGKTGSLGLCNNDAVKFSITGLETGKQALVQVTLQLQALNPYVDQMDIVCSDKDNNLSLTQTFNADNFSVSGGKFIFYVPEDYGDDWLTFTFANLYSKYGDSTYEDGEGMGRYSFVTSDYFKKVSGATQDHKDANNKIIFPKNDGLYDKTYYNNTVGIGSNDSEAGEGNYYPYSMKVNTSTAGNIRFKFNNAEDLGANVQSTTPQYLIEYPFSVDNYYASTDPGDPLATPPTSANTSKSGDFVDVKLKALDADQHSGIYFVFTADETRYNIAPTTAWQHRFYAFYRMEIELRAKSFQPILSWKKIYDKTCYYDEDEDGNVIDLEDSMWGLSLQAADKDDYENGTTTIVPEGYLTYQEIINHIQGRGEDPNADNYIPSALDNTNTTAPASMKQILYVDGSNLYAMINSSSSSQVITVNDLKKLLSTNNLVFLPNQKSLEDNVAYKTTSGTFEAGQNIVLYDKKPFFTPYTINVNYPNYATYTREVTVPANGQVTNATVMLPFTLTLENGTHTNPDGKCTFTVNTMKASQGEMKTQTGSVDFGTGYFESPEEFNKTEANRPYMIQVTDIDESLISDGKISFVVTQVGSDIIKTPTVGNTTAGQKELEGESATGDYNSTTYNFKNYGSYSGVKYDRVDGEDIFYFANNKYLNLHTLNGTKRYLYSYPFRGVYKYTTSGTQPTGAKLLRGFDISYDKNPFWDTPTDISAQKAQADLIVKAGKGIMTMSASRSQDVTILTVSGINTKRINLNAGDTRTVNLPAGVYMVNGVKIIVK